MTSVSFILHKPQLSENIGACARAIKNFNFNKLTIVNPKPLFPNDKILATSVGAKDIVNKAKVFNNLEDSLVNIDVLIATSSRFRNKNIKHINYLFIEVCKYERHSGEVVFDDMTKYLADLGFKLNRYSEASMEMHGWGDAFYVRN